MSRMFVFHGVDSKIGTTMLSQSVAESIARGNRDCKVLFVGLNGRPGTEYVDSAGESMESLKIFIDNRLLSRKEVLVSSKKSGNLYMIGGVADRKQARHFTPDAAMYFLDTVEEDFDMILVDAGNDLDNGLAIGAMERISTRLLVITQQETMLSRYEVLKPLYAKLGFSFYRTLVNKYQNEDPYDLNYISKRLAIPKEQLFRIGEVREARQAEAEKKTLLHFKDGKYSEEIEQTAELILAHCGIVRPEVAKRKKWISFI